MGRKHKQDYSISDYIGVHEIIKVLGPREITGRKHKTTEIFYITKCKMCGHEREINQRSLKNCGSGASYYCLHCPLPIQREGKKRKKRDYEIKRKNKGMLDNSDEKLFRLAIFGDLA